MTNLADGQYVVDVQTLEQGPHSEVHVHQTTAKVEATGEARDHLEICLILGTGVEPNKVAGARSRVRENFRDLEGVRLYIFGETGP